jgi:hypothetical protein
MAHWEYFLAALGGPAGLAAAWRYMPRAFLMLVGGLTAKPQRSKQCAEMIRLSRKDAKDLQSYLVDSTEHTEPPPSAATQLGQGTSPAAPALEATPRSQPPAS